MPLTIYADILVIVNLYLDFFLLWCVKRSLRLRTKSRRLVLGALLGALCSLTALLPEQPPWLSLLLGLLTALGVSAAAFCPLPPRTFCRAVLSFWAFSLLLAGFFLFLLRFFSPGNVAVLGSVVYFDLSPLLLFLFTAAAYLVLVLLRKLLPGEGPASRYQALVLENRGTSVKLWAKADTGSSLREPFSGLPVLLCQAESLGNAAPPEALEFLRSGSAGDAAPQGALRLVPFQSLGGAGVLPAFRPESVRTEKDGAPLDCWVAVCRQKLSAGQFDAIYNPDLFS